MVDLNVFACKVGIFLRIKRVTRSSLNWLKLLFKFLEYIKDGLIYNLKVAFKIIAKRYFWRAGVLFFQSEIILHFFVSFLKKM